MNDAMHDAIHAVELDEAVVLTIEVTDAALEAAAGAEWQNGGAFTVYMCTVLADCSS